MKKFFKSIGDFFVKAYRWVVNAIKKAFGSFAHIRDTIKDETSRW